MPGLLQGQQDGGRQTEHPWAGAAPSRRLLVCVAAFTRGLDTDPLGPSSHSERLVMAPGGSWVTEAFRSKRQ